MGMYESSGQITKAARKLLTEWQIARQSWNDVKMAEFEQKLIEPLQQDVRQAVETMAQMATLLDRIRRECSDVPE